MNAKLKKVLKYYVIFLIIGTIASVIFGMILKTDVFKEDAIAIKYCYIYEGGALKEVLATKTLEKGYQVIAYYYSGIEREGVFVGNDMVYMTNEISEVEVLAYTEDSLLAEIRFEVYTKDSGGFTFESTCFVPAFTLHDSVPN